MKKTLAAAAALTLIIAGCGSDADPEAGTLIDDVGASTEPGEMAEPIETEAATLPMAYGDDSVLDGLYDQCVELVGCSDLLLSSPTGSEYEQYALEQLAIIDSQITDPPGGYHGEITEVEVVAGDCPDLDTTPYGMTEPHAEGFGYKVYFAPIKAQGGRGFVYDATGGLLIQNWGNTDPEKFILIDVTWSNGKTSRYTSGWSWNSGNFSLCERGFMSLYYNEEFIGAVPTSVELELAEISDYL